MTLLIFITVILALLQIADVWTTREGLALNAIEKNKPGLKLIQKLGYGWLLAIKLALSSIFIILALLGWVSPLPLCYGAILVTTFYGGVVGNNWCVLLVQRQRATIRT